MEISKLGMNTNPSQALSKKEAADASGFESALKDAVASGDKEQLQKVSEQFESVFMMMMLKSMRSTVADGGLTEKSNARGIYESMYDQELADVTSKGGSLGIAKMIYDQMSLFMDKNTESEEDPGKEEYESLDIKG